MPIYRKPLRVIQPTRTLTLAGVDFASDEAAELASRLHLIASDFRDLTPSGKGGFTTKDVRTIAEQIGGS